MKYSSKKVAIFIASLPVVLVGLIIMVHDVLNHDLTHGTMDVLLLTCGLFLSALFYLYLKYLSRTTEQLLTAIMDFETSGKADNLPNQRDDELGKLGRALDRAFHREKKRNNKLAESEAKLGALFEVVKEGIVIADENGIIEDVNPSLCSLLGYEPTELIGKNVSILMPAPYSMHHDKYMSNATESGSMGFMGMYRDLKALSKDGSSIPVEISVDTLKLADKSWFAATLRDVSEQRAHEKQLMSAKIKAEVANQAKSNFLSMMSHEIRTPLNGVMGTVELLALEIQDLQKKDLLTVASKSATNLLRIVDDILDMSKIESGQMQLEQTSFDLNHLLQESIELYCSKALEHGIALEFDLPLKLSNKLVGDSHRLRQIVNNLLSNAIKFTQAGTVALHSDWRELGTDRIEVSITIADTGIGIAEKKLDKVFEPFMQADNSISREFGGTGLGLSIVKHLVQKMAGTIDLQSTKDVGSRFTLTIPFAKSNEVIADSTLWLQGRKVVCIDVEDAALMEYLQQHGASIERTSRAQFIQDIDEYGLRGSLFVCGTSAADSVDRINHWVQILAQDQYFLLLRDAEERWETELDERVLLVRRPILPLSLDSIFRYLYDSEEIVSIPVSTLGGEMKKILLVEDNPVNQMVAQAMLEKMGYEVVTAVNGQQGVDIMKAESVDLVLMDLHMPVMDGYEATRQIRQFTDKGLPILAMTADAGIGDRENCLAAGMDDHLAKPIKMEVLEQALKGWLEP